MSDVREVRAARFEGEWKARRLGELAKMASGGTPPTSVPAYYDGDIPWVSIADMTGSGKVTTVTERHLSDLGLENSAAYLLPEGTVLYAMYASLGECSIAGRPVCTSQAILGIQPGPSLDRDFLYYWLSGLKVTVRELGQQGTQANLNKAMVQGLRLTLPSLPEQRAIATVLSDVDELVGSLEAMMVKKRAIKQAAMQELLTGRTRLPGFTGEWRSVRLSEVGATYGGLAGKTAADFGAGNARYVSFLDVLEKVVLNWREFDRVRVSEAEAQNRVVPDDLLFDATSETPDELAMGSVVALDGDDDDLYLNSFCFGFRVADREYCDPFFLGYWSRGFPGRKAVRALAQGATRYNLSKSRFLELGLALPPLAEQQAIAGILSDMGAEIAALERRLDKTRAIKQGVMQQLLSGSIRLPMPDYDAQDADAHAA